MTKVIKDIMKLLNVTKSFANEIEDHMNIDFSECTKSQFNTEATMVCTLILKQLIK